jgi:hypothetical protein
MPMRAENFPSNFISVNLQNMRYILLLTFFGLTLMSCSGETEPKKQLVAMKINGEEVSLNTFVFNPILYDEIPQHRDPAVWVMATDESTVVKRFGFIVVQSGLSEDYTYNISYYDGTGSFVDHGINYGPDNNHFIEFDFSVNTSHKLVGTFSGSLISMDGDEAQITDGEIFIEF